MASDSKSPERGRGFSLDMDEETAKLLTPEEYTARISKMRMYKELKQALAMCRGPEKGEIQKEVDRIKLELEDMRRTRSSQSKLTRESFTHLPQLAEEDSKR